MNAAGVTLFEAPGAGVQLLAVQAQVAAAMTPPPAAKPRSYERC